MLSTRLIGQLFNSLFFRVVGFLLDKKVAQHRGSSNLVEFVQKQPNDFTSHSDIYHILICLSNTNECVQKEFVAIYLRYLSLHVHNNNEEIERKNV